MRYTGGELMIKIEDKDLFKVCERLVFLKKEKSHRKVRFVGAMTWVDNEKMTLTGDGFCILQGEPGTEK